ncbi:MAG TPA: class I SAM-dependent methyltransferase [Candidatus Limnocylindria bacterium]|nr:class I SAM-dependent methyltransferase [Candidatus Limnocylindria bacterium]
MGDRLHDYVSSGFAKTTDIYERVRPEYPDAAVDLLARELGLVRGRIVVDVGAGTGKLTRALVRTGATVIAVEPLAEMRQRLAVIVPLAVAFDGTAERMALRDASAHAITVAQAFHWFDGDQALAEFHRVLVPGGKLALIWNVRDRSVPWVDAFDAIIDRVDPERPDHQTGRWHDAFERTRDFGPLRQREFGHAQELRPDEIVERARTVSSIASLPDERREQVLDEFRALAETHPELRGRPLVTLPYITRVYWTERQRISQIS